jgi:catechol 2,3-dioxygenase-like lactoylglutathione lyase family enzyme
MEGTRITDVRTVAIPVSNQDQALEFYTGTLGFEKRMEAPLPGGGRWIEVAPPGATTTLALVAAPEGTPAGVETGIRMASTEAEADHSYLRAHGVEVGELLQWPGVPPMFTVRDPDGNGLTIVEQK